MTAANKVTAHDFTVADVAADGVRTIAGAQAKRVRVNAKGDADEAYQTALAAAFRVYTIGMATVVATRNIANHDAIAAYEVARDTGLAAAVAAAAGQGANPWLIHEAALLDAKGDRTATVVPARADLIEILDNAARRQVIAAARVDEMLAVAIVAKESFRDDAIADLVYERAIVLSAAQSALAETQSYQSY